MMKKIHILNQGNFVQFLNNSGNNEKPTTVCKNRRKKNVGYI